MQYLRREEGVSQNAAGSPIRCEREKAQTARRRSCSVAPRWPWIADQKCVLRQKLAVRRTIPRKAMDQKNTRLPKWEESRLRGTSRASQGQVSVWKANTPHVKLGGMSRSTRRGAFSRRGEIRRENEGQPCSPLSQQDVILALDRK